MKKVLKVLAICLLLFCDIGFLLNFLHYNTSNKIVSCVLIFIITNMIFKLILSFKRIPLKNNVSHNNEVDASNRGQENTTTYIQSNNVIHKNDNSIITDAEIPHLLQSTLKDTMQNNNYSSNPKFHRTPKEENMAFNFSQRYSQKISSLEHSFLESNRKANKLTSIEQKIEQCKLTILYYEQAKQFCYSKGKGGQLYFDDMWEHCHNSSNPDFSYISSVKDHIAELEHLKNYIIPTILKTVSENEGILQKNIYQYLESESKSTVQKTIRDLESSNQLKRIKKGSSYELYTNI